MEQVFIQVKLACRACVGSTMCVPGPLSPAKGSDASKSTQYTCIHVEMGNKRRLGVFFGTDTALECFDLGISRSVVG